MAGQAGREQQHATARVELQHAARVLESCHSPFSSSTASASIPALLSIVRRADTGDAAAGPMPHCRRGQRGALLRGRRIADEAIGNGSEERRRPPSRAPRPAITPSTLVSNDHAPKCCVNAGAEQHVP